MTEPKRADHRLESVNVLLDGIVDYAGLFPPAGETMRAAVANYAEYLGSSDSWALARFILPLSRLDEFEHEAGELLQGDRTGDPWRLSALVSGDAPAAVREILDFNRRHARTTGAGSALIDVVEVKASTPSEIAGQCRSLPESVTAYVEIPTSADVTALVGAIAACGARAKIRTGGVTNDSFPSADAIIDFIAACQRAGVPFKATAGLHHPLRGEYRLTYEPGSAKAMMYGYLNVFIAAALLHGGEGRAIARAALLETDPTAVAFADEAIFWRGRRIGVHRIQAAREFAISFGSCSFREPIDELAQLTRTS